MPEAVVGDFLLQHLCQPGLFRPRPDHAHFTQQHVDQLRDLIEAKLANEPAYSGYARVLIGGPGRIRWRWLMPHRAKLHDLKAPSMQPDARLPEQQRTAALQKHGDRNQRRQGAMITIAIMEITMSLIRFAASSA